MSSTAGVRLESFLFTEESIRAARDHLAPGGLFVMYNTYWEPWLVTKLDTMLADEFGSPSPREAASAMSRRSSRPGPPSMPSTGRRPG